jgi:uncharacterized protein (DUF697 family)/uncharacterized tellurite resistance protein B-like protein
MPMNDQERQAIASIALLAAFADGQKTEAEREEVRQVADSLQGGGVSLATLYRDVLLKKTTVETAAAQLSTHDLKLLAYELAIGVIDSDGLRNDRESAFLSRLAKALGLDERLTTPLDETADQLASVPLEGGDPAASVAAPVAAADASPADADADATVDAEEQANAEVAGGKIFIGTGDSSSRALTGQAASGQGTAGGIPKASRAGEVVGEALGNGASDPAKEAALDKMIINAAIMNGALELLPQSMASLAIIPMQMKLVYRIGNEYGYELDRGHVKDLLATMGVGMTGQYLEDVGRKLLGGLLGKMGGRIAGGLAKGATGIAMSFATTWAIGQVARRYYAGGRTMDAGMLKQTFSSLVEEARLLQSRYLPQIEQQSRSIDVGKLVEMVKAR